MALTLLQYEEIVTLLQRVPGLTDLLDDRATVYADEVQRWLKDCENALEQNRIPSVSQVAAHRAVLIEATRGARLADVDFTGRPTPRKVRDATATLVLRETTDLLNTVIAERQSVFAEAERLSRQAVSVARAKGLMADATDPTSLATALRSLPQRMAADSDLASVAAHLLALVGARDIVIFVDRAWETLES